MYYTIIHCKTIYCTILYYIIYTVHTINYTAYYRHILLPKQRAKEKVPDCGVEYRDVNRVRSRSRAGYVRREKSFSSKKHTYRRRCNRLSIPRSFFHSTCPFLLFAWLFQSSRVMATSCRFAFRLGPRHQPSSRRSGGGAAPLRASRLFRRAPVYLSKTVQGSRENR